MRASLTGAGGKPSLVGVIGAFLLSCASLPAPPPASADEDFGGCVTPSALSSRDDNTSCWDRITAALEPEDLERHPSLIDFPLEFSLPTAVVTFREGFGGVLVVWQEGEWRVRNSRAED